MIVSLPKKCSAVPNIGTELRTASGFWPILGKGKVPDFCSHPHKMRVFTHDSRYAHGLKNSNVLIYFPHGFGDWVQFSYILPHLDPSNRYWITRFGDHNISV